MGIESEIARRYSDQAEAYESLWSPILRPLSAPLLAELSGGEVRRVLDSGAGTGGLVPGLLDAFPGAVVFATDRSPGMLSRAAPSSHRALMDAARLGFRDKSFDVVTMVFMLFHLTEPQTGLRETHRVLRPGGRLGTATWGSEFESPAAEIWNRALDDLGAAPLESFAQSARHDLVDDPDKMKALLMGAGFSEVRTWATEHQCRVEGEPLIQLRTRLGRLKLRYDSLSYSAQHECVSVCRHRFSRLGPEDFVHHVRVVGGLAVT